MSSGPPRPNPIAVTSPGHQRTGRIRVTALPIAPVDGTRTCPTCNRTVKVTRVTCQCKAELPAVVAEVDFNDPITLTSDLPLVFGSGHGVPPQRAGGRPLVHVVLQSRGNPSSRIDGMIEVDDRGIVFVHNLSRVLTLHLLRPDGQEEETVWPMPQLSDTGSGGIRHDVKSVRHPIMHLLIVGQGFRALWEIDTRGLPHFKVGRSDTPRPLARALRAEAVMAAATTGTPPDISVSDGEFVTKAAALAALYIAPEALFDQLRSQLLASVDGDLDSSQRKTYVNALRNCGRAKVSLPLLEMLVGSDESAQVIAQVLVPDEGQSAEVERGERGSTKPKDAKSAQRTPVSKLAAIVWGGEGNPWVTLDLAEDHREEILKACQSAGWPNQGAPQDGQIDRVSRYLAYALWPVQEAFLRLVLEEEYLTRHMEQVRQGLLVRPEPSTLER